MQNKLVEHLKQMWLRMNPRQRLVVAGGTVATVVGVGVIAMAMSSTDYKPLMTGMEPDDAQTIAQQLAANKIDFKMSPDGKEIDVAASQLDAARMEVASQGTTHSGRMGFELFDKTSWGQTEFDEKVNYQRALEGELERTIGTLSDVKSARVHLVMARDSVFLDRAQPAKASVALRLKRDSLTQDQTDAIARLVSGAVENLAPADVSIIDADTNELLNRHSSTMEGRELEDELSKRLMATLGPVVGEDNLRASVNVEYDLTSSEENEDKYDPAVSALLTTQKTMEHTADEADGGVAGTASNLPLTPGQGTTQSQDANADGGSQTSTSENSTYGVNRLTRRTIAPAGRIRRITAAILVNDFSDKKMVDGKLIGSTYRRSPAQLKQLQDLAASVIGLDAQRGDVVTVENMTFANNGDENVPPGFGERLQRTVTDNAGAIKYASLLALFVLAWALVIRPVQKQVVGVVRELGPGKQESAESLEMASVPQLSMDELDHLLEADTNTVGLKRRLTEMVQAEPATMTRTLQTWLRESEG
ncbi:MAG TPA: flagellar basal-body MS-ring/collar protein FliF [Acidobacteriaceae bacterium]|nr:flagellar basal-body MS-ring/collar protein FliF [Acidobacteriaceae bacterium]